MPAEEVSISDTTTPTITSAPPRRRLAMTVGIAAGIGYLITSYRTVLDSPRVYVGILLVLLLGVLLDLVMRLLEHAATRHRPSAIPRRAAPAV